MEAVHFEYSQTRKTKDNTAAERAKRYRLNLASNNISKYNELKSARLQHQRNFWKKQRILLPKDEHEQLTAKAESLGVSIPELIRTYVTWGLENESNSLVE